MKSVDGMKNEIERDNAVRFFAEHYRSKGYHLHCHRNMEIYGVIQGAVCVNVAGIQRILTDGQVAVIDGLENHSYEIDGRAEICYLHIGTRYSSKLYSLYPQKRLPHFLLDEEFNKRIFEQIRAVVDNGQAMSELRRFGMVYQLFADIIDHYGMTDRTVNTGADQDIVTKVIQYIYDHYSECS